jgi:hypothetical protein
MSSLDITSIILPELVAAVRTEISTKEIKFVGLWLIAEIIRLKIFT